MSKIFTFIKGLFSSDFSILSRRLDFMLDNRKDLINEIKDIDEAVRNAHVVTGEYVARLEEQNNNLRDV